MIFKTYETDLDGIINKLGFSKISFAEWGTQIKTSFNEGSTVIEKFKNALSTVFTVHKETSDTLFKNSFGEIVSKDNIDSYLSKLDKDSASNLLKELQGLQSQVDTGTISWDDYFKTCEGGQKYLIDFIQNTDLQKASTEDLIKANQTAREATIAHNAALQQQTLGAKAATVATKALSVAGNMLAGIAITLVVQGIYKWIDSSVRASEIATEKAKEAKKAYDNITSELESLNSELETTKNRISELKNMDSLTLVEENELANLQKTNDELERKIRLDNSLEQATAKESAEAAKNAIDTTSNQLAYTTYNNSSDTDTINNLKGNPNYGDFKVFTDSVLTQSYYEANDIQAARYWLDQLDSNNQELKDLYFERAKIEESNSDYTNDQSWKNIDSQIKSKENWINYSEAMARQKIAYLDSVDDNFYTASGSIVEGYEDYVTSIEEVFDGYDTYLQNKEIASPSDIFYKSMKNFGLTNDNISYLLDSLSEEDINNIINTKISDLKAGIQLYLNDGQISEYEIKCILGDIQKKLDEQELKAKISWDDPSSLFEESEDKTQTATLSDLKSEASLLSSIKEQLSETGNISLDSMKSITEEYPEAKKALSDFLLGIITQQELYDELEKIYKKDTDEYINHLAEESAKDTEFWEAVYNNSSEVQSILGKMYEGDKSNFETVTEAKELIHKRFTNTLKKNYAEYMKFVVQGEDGLYKLQTKDEEILPSNIREGDSAAAEILSEADNLFSNKTAVNEINKLIEELNNDTTAIDKAVEEQLRKNLDLSYNSLGGSSSSSDTAKSYDLIERAVENLRRKMTSLKNTTDDTFASWSDRNEALINQIQTTTEQIELQQKAYDKYMQLANSTGLSDYYKGLIQNGAINEITISDKVRQEQIDSYKDYYDKAIAASEAVDELKSSLNELEKSKMDIISNEINKVKEQITSAINLIDGYIELAETSGLFASEDLYKQLIENYQKYLSNLYTEREKLNNQFEASVISGKIKEGTESWYDMQSQINEVNEAILDTIVNIKDMSNQLMNLNFEKFEYMQGKIENLTSEADFYLNLIESMDKVLYDENGSFTSEGITAAGLHAQNLNTYLQQADDYAKKLAEIEKEIANDPLNNDLTDKKQEYIEAQREAVLSAQDERNAIADLVKDGYDKQLDSLSDLISKYKDLMSAQKDAYDYEKQMSEKAETLASLKKQYEAWKGDTSEEGMKVRQELEVQIKDAQKDIQESEYDKLISDTEKLLDNLQDEYETLINERIDNIDSELQNITSSVNESASIIAGVLEDLSNDTGLPLTDAMLNIWNDTQPVADINSSVENVNDTLSGTNEAIQGLRNDVQKILSQMEKEIDATKAEIANGNANNTGNNGNSGSNNSSGSTPLSPADGSNISTGSSTSKNGSNSSNSYDWSIYKHYSSQKLNTDTSVVDRLKSNNIDASFEARSQYWDKLIGDGTYKSTYDQNDKLLNWLKNNGYANGTKSAAKGWHLFDENSLGSEVVLTKQGVLKQFEGGEHVFDAQATENLWKLAQINPDRLIPDLKLNTSLPEMAGRNAFGNVNYSCGDVSFVLPNVKNYEDIMKQAQNDKRFEKMVQEMTLGETFGHNSFKKLQY